jgi:hypothetical protein
MAAGLHAQMPVSGTQYDPTPCSTFSATLQEYPEGH